jgi:hypothetical protein
MFLGEKTAVQKGEESDRSRKQGPQNFHVDCGENMCSWKKRGQRTLGLQNKKKNNHPADVNSNFQFEVKIPLPFFFFLKIKDRPRWT